MKKSKVYIFTLLTVVLLGLLAAHFFSYKDIALEPLLNQQLSTTWYSRQLQTSLSSSTPGSAAYPWASQMKSCSWTTQGGSTLTESVYKYPSPITATVEFWLSKPEIFYKEKFPNFSSSSNNSEKYPSFWPKNSDASQESVVCAMGNPSSCSLWYYRARYRQYIFAVELFAPNEPMTAQDFALLTQKLVQTKGQELRK